MKTVAVMRDMAVGAAAGVALLTALPVFGAVGTITASGAGVGSLIGASLVLAEELIEHLDQPSSSTAKTA